MRFIDENPEALDEKVDVAGFIIGWWIAASMILNGLWLVTAQFLSQPLAARLAFAQQARVQAVFITQPHADHIRDLPHLIHNRFSQPTNPLTIFATRAVMDLLVRDLFNGVVWPDFSHIVAPATGKPAVQYRALTPGKRIPAGEPHVFSYERFHPPVDWTARHVSHLWSYNLHYFDYALDLAWQVVNTRRAFPARMASSASIAFSRCSFRSAAYRA